MENYSTKYLCNIFPEILYVADRTTTPSWKLHESMNRHNLMLIYDGMAEFTCNEKKFQASKGDLVYYKIGDFRKAHTFSDNVLKCFAIDFMYTIPVFENNEWCFINSELPLFHIQKIHDEYLLARLHELFSKLTRLALSAKNERNNEERLIFTKILTLLLEYKKDNIYNYSIIRKVEKIINYMAENYKNDITLQDIATYAQISPSYLGSIFKKITGKSTIDYLIQVRINKAKSLLLDGFTVSETSKLVGFKDIFYFSRAFKKHEGVSPSQYVALYIGEAY